MSVKITLHGDGLQYETEASLIQAAKIIGFLNTQEPLMGEYPATQQVITSPNSFLEEKAERQVSSPREAIIDSNARTNAQKIVVLGQYIIDRDATDEFASSELKALFLKAGEPAPRNLARDMRDAVRAGYIAESFDKSDAYIVTNTGYKAISENFTSSNSQPARKKKKASSTNGGSKSQPEPEWLKTITVSDQLNDFPSYRMMKTRGDKVLWILQWGKENQKDQLSGTDIVSVASKLADNIPSKQIASASSPYLSKSYISKNSEGYTILYNGTEYLKSIKA